MTSPQVSSGVDRRALLAGAAALPVLLGLPISRPAHAQADPLPSWNDGAAKKSILDFVAAVTRKGPEFVPAPQRVATTLAARLNHWTVVRMKDDWKQIFAFENIR